MDNANLSLAEIVSSLQDLYSHTEHVKNINEHMKKSEEIYQKSKDLKQINKDVDEFRRLCREQDKLCDEWSQFNRTALDTSRDLAPPQKGKVVQSFEDWFAYANEVLKQISLLEDPSRLYPQSMLLKNLLLWFGSFILAGIGSFLMCAVIAASTYYIFGNSYASTFWSLFWYVFIAIHLVVMIVGAIKNGTGATLLTVWLASLILVCGASIIITVVFSVPVYYFSGNSYSSIFWTMFWVAFILVLLVGGSALAFGSGDISEAFVLLVADGIGSAAVCALLAAPVYYFSDGSSSSIFWSIFLFVFVIMFLPAVAIGIGIADSKMKLIPDKDRVVLQQGYKVYTTFEQVKQDMESQRQRKVAEIENELWLVINQEKELLEFTSMTKNGKKTLPSEEMCGKYFEKLKLEDTQDKEKLQAEFLSLFKVFRLLPSVANWDNPGWLASPSRFLQTSPNTTSQLPGIIRIGKRKYPFPDNAAMPFLINLAECKHVFIKAARGQEMDLLKSIVARCVFSNPILSAEFIFVDPKTLGAFSAYRNLPKQMGNYDYSTSDEILGRMKALESHKKWVQGEIGDKSLEKYNQSTAAPIAYRFLCITGFPNRFTPDALASLENLIESGPRSGIHIIAQIDEQASEFASLKPFWSTVFQSGQFGAVLTPLGKEWEYSFGQERLVFTPDPAPDLQIFENILPQIKAIAEKTPRRSVRTPLKVFLCHSKQDRELVHEVYRKLIAEDWIDPWLDEKKLLPGQPWEMEIEKQVRECDSVIVFLSENSITKDGYVHKELRIALDVAQEKPEETIFIIPLRLENCTVPSRLKGRQWVDHFPPGRYEESYQRLLTSLKTRYETCASK